MREILFRGKRKDNGAWETGSLVVTWRGLSDEGVFIADKITGYHTAVDSETVGQYTGLTDKNGKKIYEGDIIQYWSTYQYTQQSFAELPPEINDTCIHKVVGVVSFGLLDELEISAFMVRRKDVNGNSPLEWVGFHDLEEVVKMTNPGIPRDEATCDADGNILDESILGIEIIGNIQDNPSLLK